jgi:hypothetical protein
VLGGWAVIEDLYVAGKPIGEFLRDEQAAKPGP